MKISIIIPTLNEEKVIGDMLQSLRSRLTLPHELIVSDGKSTDKTVEIARKYADKVVTYDGEKRQTIAEGRNAGAKAADGDFLVFFDADCTVPDFDAFFGRAIDDFKDPKLVALTAWLTVDPRYETLGDKIIFNVQNAVVFVVNNVFHGGTAPGGEFQMIRTETFMKIGGFRGQLVASEDIDMFSRLAKVGRVKIDRRLRVYHSGRRGHILGWPKAALAVVHKLDVHGIQRKSFCKRMETDKVIAMKISVIIPAYNEERYLKQTLEAILAQDYPDYEVIVVDNGSTDSTAEIASSFPTIKLVYESNKGTMWACERGRKEATGEIIVRMDADCLPENDWLSKGVAFFKNPKTAVVSGPYDFYDASFFFRKTSILIEGCIFAPLNALLQALDIKVGITLGGNTFMRASALEAIGGFNTKITFYGDDTDLPKRMSAVGKVVFSRKIVMRTSARRYKNEGVVMLQFRYLFHFFKVIFSSQSNEENTGHAKENPPIGFS